jgi:hypothetical protein
MPGDVGGNETLAFRECLLGLGDGTCSTSSCCEARVAGGYRRRPEGEWLNAALAGLGTILEFRSGAGGGKSRLGSMLKLAWRMNSSIFGVGAYFCFVPIRLASSTVSIVASESDTSEASSVALSGHACRLRLLAANCTFRVEASDAPGENGAFAFGDGDRVASGDVGTGMKLDNRRIPFTIPVSKSTFGARL